MRDMIRVTDPKDITQVALSMLSRYGVKSDGGAAWWAHEHAFSHDLDSPGMRYWLGVRSRILELARVRGGNCDAGHDWRGVDNGRVCARCMRLEPWERA